MRSILYRPKLRKLLIPLTLGILLFAASRLIPSDKPYADVTVFIIDSAESTTSRQRKIIDLFEDFSHGRIVTEILRANCKPRRLYLYNVDDAEGNIDRYRYLIALRRTVKYLDESNISSAVVNISLGMTTATDEERRLIREIIDSGAVVIAAAGNDGLPESSYPAAFPGVISVGAAARGLRQSYSNYGNIDIFAEGTYRSTQFAVRTSDTGLERYSRTVDIHGTSFSAPRVAGVAAALLQIRPELSGTDILQILQETANPVTGFENGSLNALDALAAISPRHYALRNIRNIALGIAKIIGIGVIAAVILLILLPIEEFAFRQLFPYRWRSIKIRKIEKIREKQQKSPRQIRYIVDCLLSRDEHIFDKAHNALLEIGVPAVKYLIESWHYNAANEFNDYKTPLYELIKEIGGQRSENFLRQLDEENTYQHLHDIDDS